MASKATPRRSTGGTRGHVPDCRPESIELDAVYTPEEVAAWLHISVTALRNLMYDGKIGFLPINKRQRRFLGRDILAYQARWREQATR